MEAEEDLVRCTLVNGEADALRRRPKIRRFRRRRSSSATVGAVPAVAARVEEMGEDEGVGGNERKEDEGVGEWKF